MSEIKFLNYTGLDLTITVGTNVKSFPCGGYRTPISLTPAAGITSVKVKSTDQTAGKYTIPETSITLGTTVANKTILIGVAMPTSAAAPTTVGVVPYTTSALDTALFFNCVKDDIFNGRRAVALTVTAKDSGYVALPSTLTSAMYKKRTDTIIKVATDLISGTTLCELPGAKSLGLCSGKEPSGSIFSKVWFYVLLFILIVVIIAVIGGVIYWKKYKNK